MKDTPKDRAGEQTSGGKADAEPDRPPRAIPISVEGLGFSLKIPEETLREIERKEKERLEAFEKIKHFEVGGHENHIHRPSPGPSRSVVKSGPPPRRRASSPTMSHTCCGDR